jgi:transketolase
MSLNVSENIIIMEVSKIKNLEILANKIRKHVLDMTSKGGSSHIGSVFSIVDILACLYGQLLNINSELINDIKRDRFILSKGHAGAGVYATLAECGFFDIKLLETHYQDGSNLSGHVSHKNIPGVEFSTGSLGHGLSVGVGLAVSAKLDERKNNVVVLLSDGECDEGSNWEAIMFASHHKLNNLICIIDYNKIQSLDLVSNTLNLEPFTDKWVAFGWNVIEIDGHSIQSIIEGYNLAIKSELKPTCIIAHTTKGKGVSFFENQVLWHYRTAKGEEYEKAKKELNNFK